MKKISRIRAFFIEGRPQVAPREAGMGMRTSSRALVLFVLLASTLPARAAWTIPGVVNSAGLNGTRFVSDLTVTNAGVGAAGVSIAFFPSTGAPAAAVSLAPGQTVAYQNVVERLFGASGVAGALAVSSDQPLLLRARTYNDANSGTFGVPLPVYADDRQLQTGEAGDSLWISHDASASSGYRTNVAVVFPDAGGGQARVTVYDADGTERGHKDLSTASAGFEQVSVGSFAGAVPVGRATLVVTRGRAIGYAVVVDNVTGDGSLFTFEELPAGVQDVLINGVARANGRNGTFFRTDGRFYNPTDHDATVTVSFHASGNSNAAPASASFTVPAGKIRDVVDLLSSLLGLPAGSSGALRFKSDRPVAILCRTSNVDPTGAFSGTFGSQEKPVPLLSFLNSADAGALVTGIRQNASFRTNVGFAAGADGAAVALALLNAAGAQVATSSVSLGTFGWTQPNVESLFPALTIPPDATLRVRVTSGSVDVYDSSIDNASGDSVVTPISPLPAALPSNATIGPAGGSIRSDDGRLTLRVPAGALASSVALSFTTNVSNAAPLGVGASYTLSPGALSFAKPATLVFRYGGSDTDGADAGALGLAFLSGATWYVARGGSVNAADRTLTVPIGSTTPATARPAAHPVPLEATGQEWATFLSLQVRPGKTAVPTGGHRLVALYTTGLSSSTVGAPAPLVQPVLSNEFVTAWYANGIFLGNSAEGTVTDLGHGGAEYTAPKCVPPVNPVLVAAKVTFDPGGGALPVSRQLAAKIKVLPRDWSFKSVLIHDTKCPGYIADYAEYKAGFSFSLDDDLKVIDEVPDLPSAPVYGTASACPPDKAAVRFADTEYFVNFVSGSYDAETDFFNVELTAQFPISPGYKVTNATGQVRTENPIVVPFPPTTVPFKEGSYFQSISTGPVAASWRVELKPVKASGCP
jgi:hypothetical protein